LKWTLWYDRWWTVDCCNKQHTFSKDRPKYVVWLHWSNNQKRKIKFKVQTSHYLFAKNFTDLFLSIWLFQCLNWKWGLVFLMNVHKQYEDKREVRELQRTVRSSSFTETKAVKKSICYWMLFCL
jgi:hypothetical protein